jgi:hypothetical protein
MCVGDASLAQHPEFVGVFVNKLGDEPVIEPDESDGSSTQGVD